MTPCPCKFNERKQSHREKEIHWFQDSPRAVPFAQHPLVSLASSHPAPEPAVSLQLGRKLGVKQGERTSRKLGWWLEPRQPACKLGNVSVLQGDVGVRS